MGGKRATGRSNSSNGGGGHMYPRISSGGSAKSSVMGSLPKMDSRKRDGGEQEKDLQVQYSPRKSDFDIISLLEGQEDAGTEIQRESSRLLNGEFKEKRRGNSPDPLPSFWHFVQPETESHRHNELFHHHKTLPLYKRGENIIVRHKINSGSHTKHPPPVAAGATNLPPQQNKRTLKRRKVKKKVQSAKVAGFKMLERSPERLKREGVEWIRVLTPPPGAEASSATEDEDEEDDELIKRYFSGLSSAGSSISWAEDAMESEFTSQLSKLWEDIEVVCGGGSRPEKMSDIVFDECLNWRKAFPNADLHRFTRNEAELSLVESPTLEEGDHSEGEVYDDAPFSSLLQPINYYNRSGRKGLDETVNSLQANFRSLNCATPRPNIEKSTEYVNSWLSECQNTSYVPDHQQNPLKLLDPNSRASSPLSLKNHHPDSASTAYNFTDDGNGRGKGRHSLRLVSDVARSTYAHYTRSHTKIINEPNPENFFTSLAIANNQNYRSGFGAGVDNYGLHQGRINEYDEDGDAEDDDCGRESPTSTNSTLTEIVSFRPSVRVQRPISSRIRDHTITPIATGYPHASPFGGGGGRHGSNLNRQTTLSTVSSSNSRSNTLSGSHENHQRRMMGVSDGNGMESCTSPTELSGPGSAYNQRIRSGIVKQGPSLGYGVGRGSNKQQQAPWSRHSGEDHLTMDTNYVTSLYENYPNGSGGGTNNGIGGTVPVSDRTSLRPGLRSAINSELRRSPTASLKDGFLQFDRRSVFDGGPGSIPDCGGDDQPFKPVSWLISRRGSPNS